MRRPVLLVLTAPVLAAALAACGGGADTAAPAATTTTEAAAPSSSSSQSSAAPVSSSAAASSAPAAAGTDPGPAPSGAVITAGGFSALPQTVGGFTKQPGEPDPAIIYDMGSASNTVSLLPTAEYASISTAVVEEVTPAGTGVCGKTSGGFSQTCYLAAADGVYNVNGDDDLSVADLVTFVNQLTAALGTS